MELKRTTTFASKPTFDGYRTMKLPEQLIEITPDHPMMLFDRGFRP